MKHFSALKDAYSLCEAIGSQVRMDILSEILEHRSITLSDLARNLHLTNGALTPHVKKLESVGLIRISEEPGKRGTAKVCAIALDKILIDVASFLPEKSHSFTIPVGQYRNASSGRRCALVGARGFIGISPIPNTPIAWVCGSRAARSRIRCPLRRTPKRLYPKFVFISK